MNDNTKTVTFVVVAVAVLLIAWVSRPRLVERGPDEMVGEMLVSEFDPLSAASIEILKYDEDDNKVLPFKVKQVGTTWSIPSHDNYPADAKDHLAEAAAGLLGRKILSVAGEDPGDHAEFGVLDPDAKDPKKGMGTRVTMKDKGDDVLLDLIVGKEVPDRSELHYVRRAGQDYVYTAAIETDKLSTKFEDWIEEDLLKLSTWDIKKVDIRDHSVDVLRMELLQRGEMTLEYDDAGDPRWELVRDVAFDGEGWKPIPMAENEELNTSKLDDMKYALDDLKIVDVTPKPKGLSADLKADESFVNDQGAIEDLAIRGFHVARVGDRIELFSNEGEVRVLMKDGVEYVLRFGAVTGGTSDTPEESEKKDGEERDDGDEEEPEGGGLNRYLFVTAQFNESAIPEPEYEDAPEAKPEPKAKDAKPDAKPAEGKPEETPDDAEKLQQERERIEKANQRKREEYEDKIEKGKERVQELNQRFADWYYIISDDVYQKIDLARDDIVKEKEPEEKEGEDAAGEGGEKPGDTPADFEEMKEKLPPPKEPPADAAKPQPKPAPKGKPAPKPDAKAEKPGPKEEPKPAPKPKAEPEPAAKN